MWRKNENGICNFCQFFGQTKKGSAKCMNKNATVRAYSGKKGCHASAEKGQTLVGGGLNGQN